MENQGSVSDLHSVAIFSTPVIEAPHVSAHRRFFILIEMALKSTRCQCNGHATCTSKIVHDRAYLPDFFCRHWPRHRPRDWQGQSMAQARAGAINDATLANASAENGGLNEFSDRRVRRHCFFAGLQVSSSPRHDQTVTKRGMDAQFAPQQHAKAVAVGSPVCEPIEFNPGTAAARVSAKISVTLGGNPATRAACHYRRADAGRRFSLGIAPGR